MQLFRFRKAKGKKPEEKRLFLYAGIIRKITWLDKISDLSTQQAIDDGFKNREDAIKLVCEINNRKEKNAAIITRFKPINLAYKRRQSIVFTHLLDELLKRKKITTIRMLMIPQYWKGKVVNIVFKYNPNLEKYPYGDSILQIYDYAKKNSMNDPFYKKMSFIGGN